MKKLEEKERIEKIDPKSPSINVLERMRQSLTRMMNSVIGKAEKSMIELSMLLMKHPQRYTTAKFEHLATRPFIKFIDFLYEKRLASVKAQYKAQQKKR